MGKTTGFYKLVSDGTPEGSKIFDPYGKQLPHVSSVKFQLTADKAKPVTMQIEVMAELDIEVPEDRVWIDPKEKEKGDAPSSED